MQTFATRLELRMKFANKHTTENTSLTNLYQPNRMKIALVIPWNPQKHYHSKCWTQGFFLQMHTLLIYQYFHSGIQVKTLHSSSQSRWLPQLHFLSNQDSPSNSEEHWSFNVYSSVTTLCEGMLTGHLYSSISSTSTYASPDNITLFSLPSAP